MSEPNFRHCFECGAINRHSDAVVPEVLCKRCGSQDTRRMKSEPLVAGMRWPGIFKDAAARKQIQDWYDAGLLTSPDNPVSVTESLLYSATTKPADTAAKQARGSRITAVDIQFVDVLIPAGTRLDPCGGDRPAIECAKRTEQQTCAKPLVCRFANEFRVIEERLLINE
jgi:hypothetical protein